ncbi:MAG: hypothetical protein ACLSE4_09810 [Clostridium sp.]
MFNALGESRIPLYLLIFSSVLNIFLDLYMVAALHLGVRRCRLRDLYCPGHLGGLLLPDLSATPVG